MKALEQLAEKDVKAIEDEILVLEKDVEGLEKAALGKLGIKQ